MLMPARRNKARVRTARGFSLPVPVGGLNAVDELADMDPRDAIELENFFPDAYNVMLRRGYAVHVTGLGDPIETLMTWEGPTSSKMFGAAGGDIYDVTTAGPVGAAVVTGNSSNRWQWTNFATSGGNFTLLVNGTDPYRAYNGSAWSTPSVTVATSSTFIQVQPHKGRLWFIQKDTRTAWYLPASSIAGAATAFPLGAFLQLGGKLVAMGTISNDSGIGPDDLMCFIASTGEILVYQGTDPASSATWALVGRFRTGEPVSDRPCVAFGGDLIVITSEGAISVSQLMRKGRERDDQTAVTYKIQTLFNKAVQLYSQNFGWQAIMYPVGNWTLFNVPLSTTVYQQYVINSITGAWCKFTNMNGICWTIRDDRIYFGGPDGTVYLADQGTLDNNGPITANMRTAWNYLRTRGSNKIITMIRPVMQSNGSPSILLSVSTDFGYMPPSGAITLGVSTDSLWDSARWGPGYGKWAGVNNITTAWFTSGAIGYCFSVGIKVTSAGQSLTVNSFDIQAELGGPI